jgi:hypothetical protein
MIALYYFKTLSRVFPVFIQFFICNSVEYLSLLSITVHTYRLHPLYAS